MSLAEYAEWWHTQRPGAAEAGDEPGNCSNHHQQQQQQRRPQQQQRLQQQQQEQGQQQQPQPPQPPPPQQQQQQPGRPAGADGRLLYLKDWHYVAERPDRPAYVLPQYFCEDWLNAHCDARAAVCGASGGCSDGGGGGGDGARASTADYRFVYCGPRGSWTPLHADVLRSFSWSANVAGAKRWLLLAPEHAHLLRHALRPGELAPDFFVDDLVRGGGGGGGGGDGSGSGGGGCTSGGSDDGEALRAADYPGLAAAQKLLYEVVQVDGGRALVAMP